MANTVSVIIKAFDQTGGAIAAPVANLKKLEDAGKKAASSIDMLGEAQKRLVALFAASEIGGFIKSTVEAAAQWQRTSNVMAQATGDVLLAADSLDYAKNIARELGMEMNTTVGYFAKLSAAARGTAVQGQQTREIFLGIAQAASALQLSSDQTEGALRAIEQMISKGTVQAEELRGQLGERLPGAFQLAARAMGVTTVELNKMLEQGQVISDQFLPKFAAELQKTFGGQAAANADSFTANMNRLKSSVQELQITIGNELLPTISELAKAFVMLSEDGSTFQSIGQALSATIAVIGSAAIALAGVFQIVGNRIGAVAAAVYEAASGNFAVAAQIMRDSATETDRRLQQLGVTLERVLEGGTLNKGPLTEAQKQMAELKKVQMEIEALDKRAADSASANAKKEADGQAKLLEIYDKTTAAIIKQGEAKAGAAVQAIKNANQQELALLEESTAAGLVSSEQYWAKRKEIAERGADAEVSAARIKLINAQAQLDVATSDAQRDESKAPEMFNADAARIQAQAALDAAESAKAESLIRLRTQEIEDNARRLAEAERFEEQKSEMELRRFQQTRDLMRQLEGEKLEAQLMAITTDESDGFKAQMDAALKQHEYRAELENQEYQQRLENIASIGLEEEKALEMVEVAYQAHQDRIKAIDQAAKNDKRQINMAMVSAIADAFGQMANLAQVFGKKGAAAYKVFAIAEATMATYVAANKAFASGGGWPLGAVFAAITIAQGLANVAKIKNVGQAHSGMDFVPNEGSYILQRGEMVADPGTAPGLRQMAQDYEERGGGSVMGGPQLVNVNVDGRNLFSILLDASRNGELELDSRAIRTA